MRSVGLVLALTAGLGASSALGQTKQAARQIKAEAAVPAELTPTNVGFNTQKRMPTGAMPAQGGSTRGSPAHDLCGSALAVGNGVFPFTTVGSTTDLPAAACGAEGNDIWFNYLAPANTNATFSLCGSTYDTVIAVSTACPGGGAELACNDDFCGLQSQVTVCVTGGLHYFVRVGGFASQTGTGTLTITTAGTCSTTCAAPLPGDIAENEPIANCQDGGVDNFNGGCNSTPPAFSNIANGQTVAGTTGTFVFNGLQYRDTDWYQFTTSGGNVTWHADCEFAAILGFIASPCPQGAFLFFTTGTNCQAGGITLTSNLAAGTYYAFIAPSVFTGVPCGSRYRASLTTPAPTGRCCRTAGCSVITQAACTALGGSWDPTHNDCGPSGYTITSGQGAIVAGTTDTGNHCDDCGTLITLPFAVSLYGTSYTQATVESNGSLQFTTNDATFTNACLPVAAHGPSINVWDDYRTDTAGGIFTSVTGATPNQVMHIEWQNVAYFGQAGTADFEIRLHEGSNNFEIVMGATADSGASATIGVQDGGANFTQFECNTGGANAGLMLSGVLSTPTNPCCRADINGDGQVNVADFLAFLALYAANDPRADINGSGSVNVADFLAYLALYAAGC